MRGEERRGVPDETQQQEAEEVLRLGSSNTGRGEVWGLGPGAWVWGLGSKVWVREGWGLGSGVWGMGRVVDMRCDC